MTGIKKEKKWKSDNQSFSWKEWIKKNPFFFFFFCVVILGILGRYWNWWGGKDKNFFLEEENDKVIILGLKAEELENIKENGEIKWTPHLGKNYQYSLPTKSDNFWRRINPSNYYTISEIKPADLKKKGLFVKQRQDPVLKPENINLQLFLPKSRNLLASEGNWFFNRLIELIGNVLIIFCLIIFLDLVFRTNILVSIFSMIGGFRRRINWERRAPTTKFRDIGGLEEAKEELMEIILYARNPKIFCQQGAKIPKGILLVGPPGNGKTLLARAVAGECDWAFISLSASELEGPFVGLGAGKIRGIFRQAREMGKCIIFIDEIDSIGENRNRHAYNRQSLNQLLSELDGFHPTENIVLLAATNSLNVLDPALLRPGRFDRHIYVSLPNFKARKEIIALYAQGKIFKNDFEWDEIASMTRGMSGAQIANMFNEAAILCLRYQQKAISQAILLEAFDRVLMGPSLKSQTLTPETKKIIAYHEAGHAVVGLVLPELTLRKITVIPRWTAGGYTWIDLRNKEDDILVNKNEILAQIMSFLGGRISEELIFGTGYVTTGNYSDFRNASELIRDLILRYSMSDLGIIATQNSPLFGETSLNELSEATKQKFENEREKILIECQKKVRQILQTKKNVLHLLAQALLKKNVLHKEEINYLFINERCPDTLLLK